MCNYQKCIYSITEFVGDDNEHELFLFCSFHDCSPEDVPQDCHPNPDMEEDYCPDCNAVIYPVNDCKCQLTRRPDDIPF